MKGYSFPPEGGGWRAQCLRVIDGDTILVLLDLGFTITKQERLRLSGIDTPEIYARHRKPGRELFDVRDGCARLLEGDHECDCGAEQERERARKAKDFVIDALVNTGLGCEHWPLRVVTTQEKGKYGRYLAEVYYLGEATFHDGVLESDAVPVEFNLADELLENGHAKKYGSK